jgi:hypothetical protein
MKCEEFVQEYISNILRIFQRERRWWGYIVPTESFTRGSNEGIYADEQEFLDDWDFYLRTAAVSGRDPLDVVETIERILEK